MSDRTYSSEAVHGTVNVLVGVICDQADEIRVLKADRPTPHLNAVIDQVNRLLQLARIDDHVSSGDIFAIFGDRDGS